jgi:hypothetical protein
MITTLITLLRARHPKKRIKIFTYGDDFLLFFDDNNYSRCRRALTDCGLACSGVHYPTLFPGSAHFVVSTEDIQVTMLLHALCAAARKRRLQIEN